mmetsp:Transcript_4128/g.10442  ORF Transcript_4128/g.10442 Transcript_4128/m.10442 type:complete len:324 (+) Transcript_4128:101-1072(+)
MPVFDVGAEHHPWRNLETGLAPVAADEFEEDPVPGEVHPEERTRRAPCQAATSSRLLSIFLVALLLAGYVFAPQTVRRWSSHGLAFEGLFAVPDATAVPDPSMGTSDSGLLRTELIPGAEASAARSITAAAPQSLRVMQDLGGEIPEVVSGQLSTDSWNAESDSEDASEVLSISGIQGSSHVHSLVSSLVAQVSSALGANNSPPPPSTPATPPAAAKEMSSENCNATDFRIWDIAGPDKFDSTMSTCGHACWGNAGCTEHCVSDALGYSAQCATCFSQLSTCMIGKCLWQCIGGEGQSCTDCGVQNCRPPFSECTGFQFAAGV